MENTTNTSTPTPTLTPRQLAAKRAWATRRGNVTPPPREFEEPRRGRPRLTDAQKRARKAHRTRMANLTPSTSTTNMLTLEDLQIIRNLVSRLGQLTMIELVNTLAG